MEDRLTRPIQGSRLRKRREARGWTQFDLAVKAGCTPSLVSRLESNDRENPQLNSLRGLAVAFEMTLPEFVAFLTDPEFEEAPAASA